MSGPKLSNVSSPRGAPMGRNFVNPGSPVEGELCGLHCIPLDSGGYDNGGAYWGQGERLWRVTFEDGAGAVFFRAPDRFRAWQRACEFFKMQIRVRA